MPLGNARRIALGTAQFGLEYGIANRSGQVSRAEGASILAAARSAGMDTIDTAVGYGESERRLGEIGASGWKIVTKLGAVPEDCEDVAEWVETSVRGSLGRLGVNKLHGLLLHRPENLLGARGRQLYDALLRVRERELTAGIGISIYDPAELDRLCAEYEFNLVQAPFNIFDTRIERSGWLGRLHAAGVEVHARSAFLQGILLMEPHRRPLNFPRWVAQWGKWDEWIETSGHSRAEVCLAFVLARESVDRVVVGVDDSAQLQGILTALGSRVQSLPNLETDDLELIDPSRWKAS